MGLVREVCTTNWMTLYAQKSRWKGESVVYLVEKRRTKKEIHKELSLDLKQEQGNTGSRPAVFPEEKNKKKENERRVVLSREENKNARHKTLSLEAGNQRLWAKVDK